MTVLIVILIGALAVAFIAYPLFKRQAPKGLAEPVGDKRLQELRSRQVEDEMERQVLELRQARGLFCPKCGARCQPGDRFCSHCSTNLTLGRSS